MCLLFVSLFLFQVGSPVLLRFCRQHWESMAGKNSRKHHQPSGDTQEGNSESGVDERSLLEIFIASQAKRDEEAEERRVRDKRDQLEAEERAEERRLKAEIAAEERDERRRERAKVIEADRLEKAKIAEEERMEARALEKERRKREEAMRQEEALKEREALARQAAEKAAARQEEVLREKEGSSYRQAVEKAAARQEELLREKEEADRQAATKAAALQEEATKLAYDQQKEAMEFQAELGRKAAEAQRLESQRVRLKDRAIASISAWQKVEDLEEFLLSSERKLRAGDIPEVEWLGNYGVQTEWAKWGPPGKKIV